MWKNVQGYNRPKTNSRTLCIYYVLPNTLATQSNIFDFDVHSPAYNYWSMSRNERTFSYFKQAVFMQFS